MADRSEKINELVENLHALRRHVVAGKVHCPRAPRITPAQFGALMLIEQKCDCTVKDIASALSITSSAATQLVDGLVFGGYVTKRVDQKDRRRVELLLSTKTRAHILKMKKKIAESFLKTFETLTDAEFREYCALTNKVVRGLSEKN